MPVIHIYIEITYTIRPIAVYCIYLSYERFKETLAQFILEIEYIIKIGAQ